MTTDDDMREIEAEIRNYVDYERKRAVDCERKRMLLLRRSTDDEPLDEPTLQAVLALIRQKLGGNVAQKPATCQQPEADVAQNDAEHERAVAAWEAEATRISIHCGGAMQTVQRLCAEGARLMRARPAIEPNTFTGLPDTTYEKMVAKEKAAGELLRALKGAAELIGELREYCRDAWDWRYGERWDEERAAVARAIEAAERAGFR